MSDSDTVVLKYSGLMGHTIVGVIDDKDGRPVRACETDDLEFARKLTDDPTLRVYGRVRGQGRKWELVYDRRAELAAEEIRRENLQKMEDQPRNP